MSEPAAAPDAAWAGSAGSNAAAPASAIAPMERILAITLLPQGF
jgi:hypothetical protein